LRKPRNEGGDKGMAVLLLQVFPVFIGIAVTLLVAVTFLNARKNVQASEESNPPLLKLADDAPPIDSGD
jgi:hypothetical protein